ncbi:MAG: DUF2721 domain-containing protein [Burkholderiales bacterium]
MQMQYQLTDIAHVIQLAVAPVFLLTALGTIITALNSRLSRIVDRRRVVEERLGSLPAEQGEKAQHCISELKILANRIRLIYHAMVFAVMSGILVCLVVATAFLGVFIRFDLSETVGVMFVLAMFAMVGALLMFLREVFLAIEAGKHAILLEDLTRP